MFLNRRSHALRILNLLTLLFFFISTHSAIAEEPAASTEFEEFLNKGIESAKEQKWDDALSFFNNALKIDPLSPRATFNIALVSDKAGRELLAMAWYRFYLALAPGADNAAQVDARFGDLGTATQNKIQKLKQLAYDAIKLASDPPKYDNYNSTLAIAQALFGDIEEAHKILSESKKQLGDFGPNVTAAIASSLALAGDFETAKETAAVIKDKKQKGVAFKMIAQSYAAFGNIEEAKKTAETIEHEEQKDEALVFISRAQALRGDTYGAKITAGSVAEDWERDGANGFIARVQLKNGDIAGAIVTRKEGIISNLLEMGGIDQAIDLTDRMSSYGVGNAYSKIMTYIGIANVQVDRGDHSKALETIQKALELAQSRKWERNDFSDPQYYIYKGIVNVQGKAGDLEGAMETSKLPDGHVFFKLGFDQVMAEVQARAGKVSRALKTASQASGDKHKVEAYAAIANILVEKGNTKKAKKAIRSAQKILGRMEKKNDYTVSYVAKGHARLGNYDEAFRLAETIRGEGDVYRFIAEAQIKAGDVEGAWQTAASEEAKEAGRDNIFEEIVKYYLEKDDLKKAVWSATHISNAYIEARVWRNIAESAIERGEIDYWVPKVFGEAVLGKLGEARLSWYSTISGIDDFFLAEAVMRHALKDEVVTAKNMAIVIKNDWMRAWALFWVARTRARLGDEAGANETALQIKKEKYQSMAYEHISQRLQMIQADPVKNKKILSWSDWAVYLGSKSYLSHFQRTIDMLKTETIKMNIHYLGAIAGNMRYFLKELGREKAGL